MNPPKDRIDQLLELYSKKNKVQLLKIKATATYADSPEHQAVTIALGLLESEESATRHQQTVAIASQANDIAAHANWIAKWALRAALLATAIAILAWLFPHPPVAPNKPPSPPSSPSVAPSASHPKSTAQDESPLKVSQ